MQTITISLDLHEIIYDVQNKCFLTGKSRRNADNHEQVAAIQANDDEEDANQILRSASMAFARLRCKCSEFLDLTQTDLTNELITADKQLKLSLLMPANYNTATAQAIAESAHAYIVACCVSDWFIITDKADAADYSAKAEEALKTINDALHRRVRPQRPV